MKRGMRILIVVVVATATNFGLHAAFGWGRPNHWRGHYDHHRHHHGCNHLDNNKGCANPWNHTNDDSSKMVNDTLDK